METDHDNLRAALQWSVTSPARVLRGARIAGPLGWFWLLRGHLTEGRYHLERLLTCVGDALPPRVHANLLNSAGMLAGAQGDYAQERAVYEQVLALQRRAGDRDAVAGALNNVALAALNLEDFDTGRVCLEEAVAMLRHTRAVGRLALSLGNLAGVNAEQGDWDAARPLYEEALTLMRRAGDRWGESRVLAGLAEGDLERGALTGARAHLTESLRISAELQDRQYVDTGLWLAARVFCRQGEPGRGLRLLACSHANRERLEIAIPQRDARRMEQETAACRTALGEVAFADAWAAGAAMSPEQAITEALAGLAGS
jgi:non-specific serine/threonine protein kinase